MISNTLTAAQNHDVFIHLLVLIGILAFIISLLGVKLVRMWVRKDSISAVESCHAKLEEDFLRTQANLRQVSSAHQATKLASERRIKELSTTIHNLRVQLSKAKSQGETLNQVSFDSRYGKSHRYTITGNVERLTLKEAINTITVVQHLKDGRGVLHVEHQRANIKGPVLKVFAE